MITERTINLNLTVTLEIDGQIEENAIKYSLIDSLNEHIPSVVLDTDDCVVFVNSWEYT